MLAAILIHGLSDVAASFILVSCISFSRLRGDDKDFASTDSTERERERERERPFSTLFGNVSVFFNQPTKRGCPFFSHGHRASEGFSGRTCPRGRSPHPQPVLGGHAGCVRGGGAGVPAGRRLRWVGTSATCRNGLPLAQGVLLELVPLFWFGGLYRVWSWYLILVRLGFTGKYILLF